MIAKSVSEPGQSRNCSRSLFVGFILAPVLAWLLMNV
jgi:hypothetical protein